jgi:hypothetical protein
MIASASQERFAEIKKNFASARALLHRGMEASNALQY